MLKLWSHSFKYYSWWKAEMCNTWHSVFSVKWLVLFSHQYQVKVIPQYPLHIRKRARAECWVLLYVITALVANSKQVKEPLQDKSVISDRWKTSFAIVILQGKLTLHNSWPYKKMSAFKVFYNFKVLVTTWIQKTRIVSSSCP